MADETYEGWSNYPTWCVNLWLSNDEGLYTEALEMAEFAAGQADPINGLASSLRFWVDTLPIMVDNGQGGSDTVDSLVGVHADLLGYALVQVNWLEIAGAWLEDLAGVES